MLLLVQGILAYTRGEDLKEIAAQEQRVMKEKRTGAFLKATAFSLASSRKKAFKG